jgi:GMP synthase (glutamine-hydrolysing)
VAKICVLYCGSSLTQQLYDRLLHFDLEPILLPAATPAEQVLALNPAAIMTTGSPYYVNDPKAPSIDTALYDAGIPFLGICYGMQLMARDLGGRVKRMSEPEKGSTKLSFVGPGSTLFQDFAEPACHVWMVHICKVTTLPDGFVTTASTERTEIAAMENTQRGLYAVQFHPEHIKSQTGTAILWNFLEGVCGLG